MPEYETASKNADGQGGQDSDLLIGGIIAVAATLVAEAIKALVSGPLGERSIIGGICNNTPITLTRIGDHHEHGDFKEQPPQTITPNSAIGFSSENKAILTGTEGSVTYAGDGFTATFGWDNPYIGSNSTNSSKDGVNKSRYLIVRQTGDGDSGAQMRYMLFVHPDYSVRNSLKDKCDLSKGLRSIRPDASVISVRDLVDY
jgi:hypothetical protein